jgi:hypothetical protein
VVFADVAPHHHFFSANVYKYLHITPQLSILLAQRSQSSSTSSPLPHILCSRRGPRPPLPSLLAPPASLSWSSSTASHLPRRRTSRHRRLSFTCPNERTQQPNLDHKRRPSGETNNLQIEIETPVVEMM